MPRWVRLGSRRPWTDEKFLMDTPFDVLKRDALVHLSRTFNRSLAPPDWVSINLTLKCNLHCSMCTTCYDVPKELTTREIFDIIDQVALWGVRILNPLGGEPFYRPDILDILEYACRKDFYITLTTNGTLITNEHAERIAKIAYNRLHFNFSIDGFKEVHDRIRGPGMLEHTLAGLKRIREADARAGNPPRTIQVNTVVNNLNLETIPSFLEYVRGLGFQGIQLLNLFKKAGADIPVEIRHLWIPRERWPLLDRVVEEVRAYRQRCDPLEFSVLNTEHELDIMKLYYRGTLPPRDALCYAGWKELYINADGQAIMCDGSLDFLKGAFGSVRTRTIQEIWHSEALRERRRVVKSCQTPCIQDCYLRERSDSALSIGRRFIGLAAKEVRARLPRRGAKWVPFRDTMLTLELSDVADVNPPHLLGRSADRFERFAAHSPVPFERCYTDPFVFYEMRNRGHLSFNRGFMGLELVKKMIPDLVRRGMGFETVRLGFRGDPLLHPEFVLVYRYLLESIARHGLFKRILIETHATVMNTEYVDLAMEYPSVNQVFRVHLDAATRECYLRVNRKDLFETVLERMDYLLAMKARHAHPALRIVPSFVFLPNNVADAADVVSLWRDRFRAQGLEPPETAFDRLPPWDPDEQGRDLLLFQRHDGAHYLQQLEANAAYLEGLRILGVPNRPVDRDRGRAPRCAAPFKSPTISWDGKVTVCDRDLLLKLRVGEVTTDDLSAIWWRNDPIADLRESVRRRDLHQRIPCRDCRQPFSPNAPLLSDEELERYRLTMNRSWAV